MDLSANLRAIVSQRLVRTADAKGRKAAIEILINTPTIAERIFKGEFHELKAIMAKSRELGMRTFDWALFELYNEGHIAYEEAIRNADSANELRLNIKLKSARGEPPSTASVCQPAAPSKRWATIISVLMLCCSAANLEKGWSPAHGEIRSKRKRRSPPLARNRKRFCGRKAIMRQRSAFLG